MRAMRRCAGAEIGSKRDPPRTRRGPRPANPAGMDHHMAMAARRRQMVALIVSQGVTDVAVLEAMLEVPREDFVPPALRPYAHDDRPLPIDGGQTISQPYIVALMAAALRLTPTARVLEVGTGTGYAAAVLARLAREVFSIERHPGLVAAAGVRLALLGQGNVRVRRGDGTLGWPQHAPFDAISVAAGGPRVPPALLSQLAPGGRLVVPVGPSPERQRLICVTRVGDHTLEQVDLGGVIFVPLVGEQGWSSSRPVA
jgi:protein-L-isoaspartate(D-aspartate) O-methyltransferase